MEQLDHAFGTLRDAVGDALGGIQGVIHFGGGQPVSGTVAIGERRVMSGFALLLVLVGGVLLGMVLKGGK